MPEHFLFLYLPRELREIIYEFYVYERHGYHFDYASSKLQASNRPVNLSLMYTCTTIAAEMRGLALKTNIVVFPTIYSETERIKAGYFGDLLKRISIIHHKALCLARDGDMRFVRTPEFSEELARKFPRVKPQSYEPLDWDEERAERVAHGNIYGAPSTNRAYDNFVLTFLTKKPGFIESLNTGPRWSHSWPFQTNDALQAFKDLNLDPWTVPSEEDFAIMTKDTTWGDRSSQMRGWLDENENLWQRIKFRFSAAAAAIRFLKSISLNTRLQIRRILLHEDHEAVAYPACHALGLIPFCVENAKLHIERRVSLWRNMLPDGHQCLSRMVGDSNRLQTDNYRGDEFRLGQTDFVTPTFCSWIKEVFALFDAGMPHGSFSLVFDGESTPDRSSDIFELVQQDVAWQLALQKYYIKASIKPKLYELKDTGCFLFSEFPRLINEIVEGKSCISCNFPIKPPPDVDQIFEENCHDPPGKGWNDRHLLSQPAFYQTSSPLPPWIDLRFERLIPKDIYVAGLEDERAQERAQAALSYFQDSIEGCMKCMEMNPQIPVEPT